MGMPGEVMEEGDECKAANKALRATVWLATMNRLAIASEAVSMWDLAAALTHIDVCLKVGEQCRCNNLGMAGQC